jgi:hypothetical protein
MARASTVPQELTRRPFSLNEARTAGLTHSSLKGRAWRRLGRGLYCWEEMPNDPWGLLAAWRRILPAEAAFGSATAAWMFGLHIDFPDRLDVIVPRDSGMRSRSSVNVRRCDVAEADLAIVRGIRATSLQRTLCDLCIQRSAVDVLVVIDSAISKRLTNADALRSYALAANGRAGAGRLRALAALAAPAESPMETRLRWLLLEAGLPRPDVQIELRDGDGRFVGRADLYYPAVRLVIEYDGENHRDRMVEDDRRQNLLANAGFRLLRFTASDVYKRSEVVVAQVRAALGARLAPMVPYPGS